LVSKARLHQRQIFVSGVLAKTGTQSVLVSAENGVLHGCYGFKGGQALQAVSELLGDDG
jgi:hypothetical protein